MAVTRIWLIISLTDIIYCFIVYLQLIVHYFLQSFIFKWEWHNILILTVRHRAKFASFQVTIQLCINVMKTCKVAVKAKYNERSHNKVLWWGKCKYGWWSVNIFYGCLFNSAPTLHVVRTIFKLNCKTQLCWWNTMSLNIHLSIKTPHKGFNMNVVAGFKA